MMTTYTRRGPGQSYLKVVLQDRINELVQMSNLDLEINPLKVYEKMVRDYEAQHGDLPPDMPKSVTAEEAAENRTVQMVIEPRVDALMKIGNNFLDTIISGLDDAPYGIRWICKQIRSLSKRKYPDAQDQTICTLIGGFFFLRFINPAIVTPRSYMLIENNPGENPRRTLTYVCSFLDLLMQKC
jgi:Ras GTPase-activating-like protein IQGAP2/3